MDSIRNLTLKSFEELEFHLKNCIHWNTTEVEGPYDFNGIVTLLNAVTDNLRLKTHEEEIKEIRGILSNENLVFLKKIIGNN